jgi:glycosyltransferase involved in cell wall biosynthesis
MPLDKKNIKYISVYFIVPAPPGISPGQRFRFEHYLSILEENNIHFRISHFYTLKAWKTLYTHGNKFRKVFSVFAGFFTRFMDLFRIGRYTYIYIYREAVPIGPPFFEWIMAKMLRKKIIYDFDDAIWIPATSTFNKAISKIKYTGKVAKICLWSYKISVGNQFLEKFARQNNSRVFIIPTVVNTKVAHTKQQDQQTLTPAIGWTGSFSTLKYLNIVLPVLQQLQMRYDFTFVVIADKNPMPSLKNYKFIKWTVETEVDDLLNFHIGLMPLYDDDISKGKCGFKAIQYMSLGIPAVVSPVGVNAEIVNDGINGFLCKTEDDWKKRLEELLLNSSLRANLGLAAKKKIEEKYSVQSTTGMFLDLFTSKA